MTGDEHLAMGYPPGSKAPSLSTGNLMTAVISPCISPSPYHGFAASKVQKVA